MKKWKPPTKAQWEQMSARLNQAAQNLAVHEKSREIRNALMDDIAALQAGTDALRAENARLKQALEANNENG